MSGDRVDLERCVPGSVFVVKPLQHSAILSACQAEQQMSVFGEPVAEIFRLRQSHICYALTPRA